MSVADTGSWAKRCGTEWDNAHRAYNLSQPFLPQLTASFLRRAAYHVDLVDSEYLLRVLARYAEFGVMEQPYHSMFAVVVGKEFRP